MPQGTSIKRSIFRLLADPRPWHEGCPPRGMKLTQPILTTLSRELSHGNPWWALVVLNEYLRPTTPLHTAFVSHCKRRMPLDSQLARRLYAGARYEELSLEERACVGVRTMTHPSHAPCARRFTSANQTTKPTTRHHAPTPSTQTTTPSARKRGNDRPLYLEGFARCSRSACSTRIRS
jgi:hypothetical protein